MEDTLVNIDGEWCRLYVFRDSTPSPDSPTSPAATWRVESSEFDLEVQEWRPLQNLRIISAAATGVIRAAKQKKLRMEFERKQDADK